MYSVRYVDVRCTDIVLLGFECNSAGSRKYVRYQPVSAILHYRYIQVILYKHSG